MPGFKITIFRKNSFITQENCERFFFFTAILNAFEQHTVSGASIV